MDIKDFIGKVVINRETKKRYAISSGDLILKEVNLTEKFKKA